MTELIMNEINKPQSGSEKIGAIKSFFIALPMMLLTLLLLSGGKKPSDGYAFVALAATYILFNSIFYLMVKTGKTDKYRLPLYFTSSILFVFSFISHMLEARGSMAFTDDTLINCQIPFCHIATTMMIIPAALTKTIIFPGTMIGGYASIASMLVVWIGVSLSIGRGWCSWGCFFGGMDDGFSRFLKKPVIAKISENLKYMPYAVLLTVALTSAVYLSPTYCEWACPYKTVTEYQSVTSIESLIKMIVCVSLFISLVIALPLLTKKRTQCALFCPFGAMQGAANYISPFDITIDREKCVKCMACVKNCPTLSLDEACVKEGRAAITCVKCGKCVDICPKGAAQIHIKGTIYGLNPTAKRILFIYAAFLLFATFSGGWFQASLAKIFKLIATGVI